MQHLLILLFFLLMILVLLIPVKIILHYRKDHKDDILTIKIEIKPFFQKEIKIPKILFKVKKNQPALEIEMEEFNESTSGQNKEMTHEDVDDFSLFEAISHFKDVLHRIRDFYHTYDHPVHYVMKKTTCQWFEWNTEVGNHNPAVTGIGTGLLWNIKSQIVGFLSHSIQFTKEHPPRIFVAPNFEKPQFYVQLDCIFTIKLGHIIKAGIEMGFTKLKNIASRSFAGSNQQVAGRKR